MIWRGWRGKGIIITLSHIERIIHAELLGMKYGAEHTVRESGRRIVHIYAPTRWQLLQEQPNRKRAGTEQARFEWA